MIAVTAGCGREGPRVQLVEGRVLLDGQPIAGASVGFSPLEGTAALPGIGLTKEDGSFRLTATRGGPPHRGVPEGNYGVVISKVSSVDPDASDPPPVAEHGFPKFIRPQRIGETPYLLHLPEAYSDRERSGLRVTVKTGKNRVQFDLRSDFRGESARSGGAAGRAVP